MSLLSEAYEAFIIMDRRTVPDGYGGVETTWTEGAEIQAAATYNSSVEALTAQAAGATALYTITTSPVHGDHDQDAESAIPRCCEARP